MSMNAKERMQALQNVEWDQGAFCLGIVLPEAGAKEESKERVGMALGRSVLEGGLGNGWKN